MKVSKYQSLVLLAESVSQLRAATRLAKRKTNDRARRLLLNCRKRTVRRAELCKRLFSADDALSREYRKHFAETITQIRQNKS